MSAFREFETLTVISLLPLHGESSDDLTNIPQQAHSVSLKFFLSFLSFSVANEKHIEAN